MNRSTPGLPVHHQLPEFTQTHVHRVSDAIQPSHPLSSPSPPAPNLSQHQSFPMSQLFTWGGQSTGVSALASFFCLVTAKISFFSPPQLRNRMLWNSLKIRIYLFFKKEGNYYFMKKKMPLRKKSKNIMFWRTVLIPKPNFLFTN